MAIKSSSPGCKNAVRVYPFYPRKENGFSHEEAQNSQKERVLKVEFNKMTHLKGEDKIHKITFSNFLKICVIRVICG